MYIFSVSVICVYLLFIKEIKTEVGLEPDENLDGDQQQPTHDSTLGKVYTCTSITGVDWGGVRGDGGIHYVLESQAFPPMLWMFKTMFVLRMN